MTAKTPKKILITTAIDYTNDVIHIGHAYQKVFSDVLCRFFKLQGNNVRFLTGTDEHGTTNEKAAVERELSPQEHVNDISQKDKLEIDSLGVVYDRFIRTTDADHKKIAAEFFKKSYDAGDIYKGTYEGLYCDSCESYKTLSDLNEEGQCVFHPTKKIHTISEENYFFKWSKYAEFLHELVSKDDFVLPEGKKVEMLAFIRDGLEDIAVTRPKYKVSWGIECPIDTTQVIYVWFDALINYYTYGVQEGFWDSDTKIVHILGKDNAKWHALLWPAMLKSVGYMLPSSIYVHGFINLDGQKISKSRGNVIRPTELVNRYGVDTIRYYLAKHGPVVEDVDISLKHLEEVYNSDLANGLGNTAARLAKLAEKSDAEYEFSDHILGEDVASVLSPLNEYRVDLVLHNILIKLSNLEKKITEEAPWKVTDSNQLRQILTEEINDFRKIIYYLDPIIPNAAKLLREQFFVKEIRTTAPLFPRLN